MTKKSSNRVAIIAGARTPFVKTATQFKKYSALDLASHAVDGLLEKLQIDPQSIDELFYGIVVVNARIPHFARELVLSSKLPASVRALTIADNCISGLSAISLMSDSIITGRAAVGIAGGVESMSNPTVMFNEHASRILLDAHAARSFGKKLKKFLSLRPADLKPSISVAKEPSTGLSMGEHCELMVKQWKVTRQEQDEIALRSHKRAHKATEDGRLKAEILPLDGVDHDLTIRVDTTLEKLGKLRPVFDQTESATITAGNASPLTDGAASVLLMSEKRARNEGREALAFIKAIEFVGIDPDDGLLMGPGVAVPRVLQRVGLKLSDMDIIEMHEAFAGQIACNLSAWRQGWKEPAIGEVEIDKLNPLGSSLAVGHPFAATGARIVTTLANEMKRRNARYGLVSICGAGATAATLILERA